MSPALLIRAFRKCAYLVGSWESDGIKENNPTERYDLLADKIEKRLLHLLLVDEDYIRSCIEQDRMAKQFGWEGYEPYNIQKKYYYEGEE